MLIMEILSAFVSASIISPVMTLIDSSIIYSQINNILFLEAAKKKALYYANDKKSFIRPHTIMFGVYFSTYSTANVVDHICTQREIDGRKYVFISTSLVNIIAIGYKDREYSRLFHQQKICFPRSSLILFALRDSLTICSSFIWKKDVSHLLERYMHMDKQKSDFVSSLIVPISVQLFSTPIHIYALDRYLRPQYIDVLGRLTHIKNIYKQVCMGRIIRVIPAFCIGGYLNDKLRSMNTKYM
jgi:hypothetical protein